jgi:hypothetical protein
LEITLITTEKMEMMTQSPDGFRRSYLLTPLCLGLLRERTLLYVDLVTGCRVDLLSYLAPLKMFFVVDLWIALGIKVQMNKAIMEHRVLLQLLT